MPHPTETQIAEGLGFMNAGGDVGALVRDYDWSRTSLGDPTAWPEGLKVLVNLILTSKQPMFLAWGDDQVWIYNDAFVPIAGRKHPDSLGRPSREVWSEAWADLRPLFDRVYGGDAVHMTSFSVGLDRQGVVEEAVFDFSYTPVRTEGAEVRGLFGVCIETTERVREERQTIVDAKRERDSIFEMSRDLIGVATFDGYLKSINPSWSRQLGRSDEELLSRPFAEIIHPDDLAVTGAVVETLERGEPVHQFLVRLLKADGSPIDFAWSAVPAPGGATFYTVGRDITEDLRRQEILGHSQKMEAIGQLTGGIAHDFNNLLQVLHGNLDLIRRKPNEPERVARLAGNGLLASERASTLTAQLLAFSRSQKLELRPTALEPLIGRLTDLLERTLGPRVRVTLESVALDTGVMADPTQLEMALLNLAINARDAMPDGGDLVVSNRRMVIDHHPVLSPGEYVEIRVADTGSGMTAEVAARAFDPFFTTKDIGQGTGLGLSQVYAMVSQAGGHVRLDARQPHGTTVVLLLPAVTAPGPKADTPAAVHTATLGAAKTILVVDDDPAVRAFLVDTLEGLGFAVIAAVDGPTALTSLEGSDPDIVLLDFAMPGMTGAQVADRVRVLRPHLPIVFATGYSDTAAIEDAVGPDAMLLKKPFRVTDLEAMITEALASAR